MQCQAFSIPSDGTGIVALLTSQVPQASEDNSNYPGQAD